MMDDAAAAEPEDAISRRRRRDERFALVTRCQVSGASALADFDWLDMNLDELRGLPHRPKKRIPHTAPEDRMTGTSEDWKCLGQCPKANPRHSGPRTRVPGTAPEGRMP